MKSIAVINQKGGVGKTTTTVNLGAALARLGSRVLLLDLDPQSNLTLHVDRTEELKDKTMTRLLVDDVPIADLLQETREPNVYVIPADTTLGGVEQSLANRIGRETILREAFDAYQGEPFDYVLFDCPPSLGVLSANALCCADEVLIPLQTEYFSLQGMAKLTEVIELVQRRLNTSLQILCVLPCMVDLRTRLTTEVLENVRGYFGDRLARTLIRNNVKLAEAPSFGVSIFAHAPDSNGAIDYWCLGLEVLERHGLHITEERFRVIAGEEVADQIYGSLDEDEDEGEEGEFEDEQAELELAADEPVDAEPVDEGSDGGDSLDGDPSDEEPVDEGAREEVLENDLPVVSDGEPESVSAVEQAREAIAADEVSLEPETPEVDEVPSPERGFEVPRDEPLTRGFSTQDPVENEAESAMEFGAGEEDSNFPRD
ncbi:MAG: AAA family ATPase [Planctomycetota bacterium]